ncbi:MAG: SPOR domain-containing protein, partial [Desulfobulbaceae bacterium]|nr:SPOR domain-containing protein [Desulfobulbaceae bacterium]
EMFEVVATLSSIGPSAESGGFVGCLFPDELDASLGAALWDKKAFAEPTIVETTQGAHVVQRVQAFDPELWRIQIAALKHPKPVRAASMVQGKGEDEGEGRYIVHAGTYNGPLLAASMVSRLRDNKLPAYFYTSRNKKGGLIYQVVAGRYSGKADAQAVSRRLDGLGIKNFIGTAPDKKAVPSAPEKEVAVAKGGAVGDKAVAKPQSTPVQGPEKKQVAAVASSPEKVEKPAPRKAKPESVSVATSSVSQREALPASLIIEAKGDEPAGRYTVHAGTSDDRVKSEEFVVRMRKAGLPAFAYLSRTKKGESVYRLVGGRFNDMHSARAAHRRLTELGISNFIANTK